MDFIDRSEFNEKMGERFRKLRERVGLRQSDVAKLLRVSKVYMHQLETGKRGLSYYSFSRLLHFYKEIWRVKKLKSDSERQGKILSLLKRGESQDSATETPKLSKGAQRNFNLGDM